MNIEAYIDGGSRGNPGPAAAGVVLCSQGKVLLQAGYFLGHMTNNQAEYHALLRALAEAARHKPAELTVYSDSELLVRQVLGEYKVKNAALRKLHEQAQMQLLRIGPWQIKHIPREHNTLADSLVNAAIDAKQDVDRTAQAVPHPSGPKRPRRRRLIIRVEEAPAAGGCPAGLMEGDFFYLSEAMPFGLCTYLAQSIIQVAVAMLDAEKEMPEVPVRCRRAGCHALVTVAVEADSL
jgi:ribonuclease HI